MAASKQTFQDVLAGRKNNPHVLWAGADETTATWRLQANDFLKVGVSPKFKLRRKSRVLTIGSCFARNVEVKLARAGVALASEAFALPPESYVGPTHPKTALNKYNIPSIESEFGFALGLMQAADMGLIQAGDDEWWDPLSSHTKPGKREAIVAARHRINAVTRRVVDCDGVIITLGLNEVWTDLETGVFLNVSPPSNLLRRHTKRFAVVIADLEDNLASLKRTISTIHDVAPNAKIIITVSPVPMGSTLTNMDVIVANTLSKSMLRVAANALANAYDFVDYFPSYEMVVNSPPELAWAEDRAHVKDGAVEFVTNYFVEKYMEDAS